jgi:hypothetical protein
MRTKSEDAVHSFLLGSLSIGDIGNKENILRIAEAIFEIKE